jgi:ribose 5-phosphate isomerase RpiB
MGARSVPPDLAASVVAGWLGAEFRENPRRAGKMAKLRAIEARYLG